MSQAISRYGAIESQIVISGCVFTVRFTKRGKDTGGGVVASSLYIFRVSRAVSNAGLVLSLGDLKKKKNDTDGSVLFDSMDFTLNDALYSTGIEYADSYGIGSGAPESIVSVSDVCIVEGFFADTSSIYSVSVKCCDINGDESYIYVGDIPIEEITFSHLFVHDADSSSETRTQTVSIGSVAIGERLKRFTMQELFDSLLWSDVRDSTYGDLTTVPFYCGYTYKLAPKNQTLTPTAKDVKDFTLGQSGNVTAQILAMTGKASDDLTIASPRIYDDVVLQGETVWGDKSGGYFGIRLITLVRKVAELCGFGFNPATDYTSPFSLVMEEANNTPSFHFDESEHGFEEACICLNGVFGYSPLDGSLWKNPLAIDRASGVSELLRYLTRFAMRFSCELDAYGTPILRMISVEENVGTFPTIQLLQDSKESARIIGDSDYIKVSTKSAEGSYIIPSYNLSGKEITWEVPFRVKEVGEATVTSNMFTHKNVMFNGNFHWYEQWKCFRTKDDENLSTNPDQWIWMSQLFIFYVDSGSPNVNKYLAPNTPPFQATYTGYYAVSKLKHIDSGFSAGNTALPVGQVMARQLIGTRIKVEREYGPFLASHFQTMLPGITSSYRSRGTTEAVEAEEITFKFSGPNAFGINWQGVPDSGIIPFPYKEEDNKESSSVSGGNSKGGETIVSFTSLLGNGIIFVDYTSENEPTGSDPPNGFAIVDGDPIPPVSEEASCTFLIREGISAGIYFVHDSGTWDLLEQETSRFFERGHFAYVGYGNLAVATLWQFNEQFASLGFTTLDCMQIPLQSALSVEGDFDGTAIANTTAGIGGKIIIPISNPSTILTPNANTIIEIDPGGAYADTLKVRVTGMYHIDFVLRVTTKSTWPGGYIYTTYADESGAIFGNGLLGCMYFPAGIATADIQGDFEIEISSLHDNSHSLPNGIKFYVWQSTGVSRTLEIPVWRIDAHLSERVAL